MRLSKRIVIGITLIAGIAGMLIGAVIAKPAFQSHVFGSLLVSVLGAWAGYHAVYGLRFGVANARGARYARSTRPVMFWFIVGMQIAFTFLCGYFLFRNVYL